MQNPQGIAVNSFLFEENLQLGNRPFYDLFAVVIGCGWSCAGAARLHGLFPDFPGEFAPAFCFPRASPPLFLTFVSAEVGSSRRLRDRGVRSGLGSRRDSRAARPGCPSRLPPEPAGSPEGAPGAEPPAAAHTPAGSRPPALPGRPRPRASPPGPSSNMSPNLPPRVRAARQSLMDSSRRRGRPPAARQPPGKSRPPGARPSCPRHRLGQWVPPSRSPVLPKYPGIVLGISLPDACPLGLEVGSCWAQKCIGDSFVPPPPPRDPLTWEPSDPVPHPTPESALGRRVCRWLLDTSVWLGVGVNKGFL